MYADVVGYSRLIGLDAEGTQARLRAIRRELIDPEIRRHEARIVNSAGDSLLVEVPSIAAAVRCAVQIQRHFPEYDGDCSPETRIRFRIGVNIGDVLAEGSEMYGDSVNVAARLQAECPAGGICVSRPVRDHVRDVLNLNFQELGPLNLKNIARPVEAFVLALDPSTASPTLVAPARTAAKRWNWLLPSVVAVLILVLGGAALWYRLNTARTASSAAAIASAPRLSLVVLPFENISGDPGQDYLAEGVTEDLTTDLANIPGAFVIARSTAYSYKSHPANIRQIGQELRVRYVLEGSVRKLGDVVRVNAQLISAADGVHVWSDRFDESMNELAEGQNLIVNRIGSALSVELIDLESARSLRERPDNPDDLDLILRANSLLNKPPSEQRFDQAQALLEEVLQRNPTSVRAMTELAMVLVARGNALGLEIPADGLERAGRLVTQAEAINPTATSTLAARAYLLRAEGRWPEALVAFQRLSEANPNNAPFHLMRGICLIETGRPEEAIVAYRRAIQLNPRGQNEWANEWRLGQALLLLRRYNEAISALERAQDANPGNSSSNRSNILLALASAQALAGDLTDAKENVARAVSLQPFHTARAFLPELRHVANFGPSVERAQEGLRLAGLRDHADEQADFGVVSDDGLHPSPGRTPTTAPDVKTIQTTDLERFITKKKPLVLDINAWGLSIPGAIALPGAGRAGTLSDALQVRLRRTMPVLTHGNAATPIVTMSWNSESFAGRNLAIRLAALGYTNVYWYRGGREAWEVNGLPEAEPSVQPWQ
ncbi:MAG: tetratricopeptide repeat protein [Acetobacteraceae bacterium]|nr:tetratricopeptide repeat protein [Acetobacteraceae bacterium]